jgi:hypothetical protein
MAGMLKRRHGTSPAVLQMNGFKTEPCTHAHRACFLLTTRSKHDFCCVYAFKAEPWL